MKKFLTRALLLAFVCLGFAFSLQANAAEEFTDLSKDHWAYKHVMELKGKGIVVGYPDNSFHPDENVTRAEFAAIIVNALKLQDKGDFFPVAYKDLAEYYWGYNVIQTATHYGLVTGTPDGYFLPNDPVKRVEVMMVVINTLAIKELTAEQAKEYLSVYPDASECPSWALLRAGKAQQLEMIATRPESEGRLEPLRPATRAEVAIFVYNMLERVKVHPNKKIAGELPKVVDGYVLDNVYIEGTTATIPAGTILPLGVMTHTDSKLAKQGDEFTARTLKNFVNKDSILLIPVGTRFSGHVEKAKKGVPVLRNATMVLATESLTDHDGGLKSDFLAVSDVKANLADNTLLEKFCYYVFKGRNYILHRSQVKEFILLEPVKVDVMKNWIVQ